MRKIIECTLVSVDGLIGDPHLWAMQYFDQAAQDDALSLLSNSDAMLMGRRTYEIFPLSGQRKAARTLTSSKTSVSTCSPPRSNEPTGIMRPLLEEVAAEGAMLKSQDGQDIVMYGHGLLIREGEQTKLKVGATKALKTVVITVSYLPTAA